MQSRYHEESREGNAVEYPQDAKESKGTAGFRHRALTVRTNAVDKNHAPEDKKRLDAVREGVCLERPRDIRRRHERNSHGPFPSYRQELMQRPVLEDEAEDEHEQSERVKGEHGLHIAVAETLPDPFEDCEGEGVDELEGENAADGVVGFEFPGWVGGPAEDLA